MYFIADLHIHSKYSRATSKQCTIPELFKAAIIKGVQLLGTGDFTHPAWFAEIREYLEEDGQGLLKLKAEIENQLRKELPSNLQKEDMRFILSTEISSIYKKGDKTRKIHNVVIFPSLESVEKFNKKLNAIGNIRSDGRPILGLDARNLLEIALEVDKDVLFIPAHIWTPWFSLFGSKSGFDSIEECFEDLTHHIFALETGLSSDPPMNWRLSALDRFNLVSNSDCHSPDNIAREANLFNTDLNYYAIYNALKDKNSSGFLGTIEFFPEEGKYHFDGHRNCGVRLTPKEAIKHNLICPVCGRRVTVGVLHRVEELADREEGARPPLRKDYKNLIPLKEIIGDAIGVGKNTKSVRVQYERLINRVGSELYILEKAGLDIIARVTDDMVAEGIRRVRAGEVKLEPGYDGEYGKIHVFTKEEREGLQNHLWLVNIPPEQKTVEQPTSLPKVRDTGSDYKAHKLPKPEGLNKHQQEAVEAKERIVVVIAGPGSGKTHTLVEKIKHEHIQNPPARLLAFTFTNRAAEEMKQRLPEGRPLKIGTFHSVCIDMLKQKGIELEIIDEQDAVFILKRLGIKHARKLYDKILFYKSRLIPPQDVTEPDVREAYKLYEDYLQKHNAVDYEGIILEALKALDDFEFDIVFVDEFQDLNLAEYELIKKIIGSTARLFVIGDPYQSIYQFRGSLPDIFERISRDFEVRVINLKTNYRNPEFIGRSAEVIVKRKETMDYFSNVRGKVEIIEAPTELSAAIWISKKINELTGGFDMNIRQGIYSEYSLRDMAILTRMRRLLKTLETALSVEGVPYEVIGDTSLLERREVQNVISIFDIVQNGLTQLKQEILFSRLGINASDFWQGLENFEPELKKVIESYMNREKIEPVKLVEELHFLFSDAQVFEFFKAFSAKYEDLSQLLRTVTTGKEQDIEYGSAEPEKVRLLTFHSAKGLEFPVIFIYNAVEGIVPMTLLDAEEAEERRLFYVALTRAAEKVYIVNSRKVSLFGKTIAVSSTPLLSEFPKELFSTTILHYDKPQRPSQMELW